MITDLKAIQNVIDMARAVSTSATKVIPRTPYIYVPVHHLANLEEALDKFDQSQTRRRTEE